MKILKSSSWRTWVSAGILLLYEQIVDRWEWEKEPLLTEHLSVLLLHWVDLPPLDLHPRIYFRWLSYYFGLVLFPFCANVWLWIIGIQIYPWFGAFFLFSQLICHTSYVDHPPLVLLFRVCSCGIISRERGSFFREAKGHEYVCDLLEIGCSVHGS